jgi:hypothetical protein
MQLELPTKKVRLRQNARFRDRYRVRLLVANCLLVPQRELDQTY